MERCHTDNTQYALWHYLLLKAVKTLENVSHFCRLVTMYSYRETDRVWISRKNGERYEYWHLAGKRKWRKLLSPAKYQSAGVLVATTYQTALITSELYLAKYITHLFFGFYAKHPLIDFLVIKFRLTAAGKYFVFHFLYWILWALSWHAAPNRPYPFPLKN